MSSSLCSQINFLIGEVPSHVMYNTSRIARLFDIYICFPSDYYGTSPVMLFVAYCGRSIGRLVTFSFPNHHSRTPWPFFLLVHPFVLCSRGTLLNMGPQGQTWPIKPVPINNSRTHLPTFLKLGHISILGSRGPILIMGSLDQRPMSPRSNVPKPLPIVLKVTIYQK